MRPAVTCSQHSVHAIVHVSMVQAVFTSSYLHSAIIYVAVVLFSVYVYSGSDGHPISSIGKVYDNLKARSAVRS